MRGNHRGGFHGVSLAVHASPDERMALLARREATPGRDITYGEPLNRRDCLARKFSIGCPRKPMQQ